MSRVAKPRWLDWCSRRQAIAQNGLAGRVVVSIARSLVACGPAAICAEGASLPPNEYEPTWESLDRHPVARWWLDAKFGVYAHWSLASVPAWGNHFSFYWLDLLKSQKLEAAGPRPPKNDVNEEYVGLWQFHQNTYGAQFKYEDFAPMFRAEVFDPERWAEIFARSGARYVVPTTKHHDGFCLWPSAEASRSCGHPWNAVDTGPRRDLVGALADAEHQAEPGSLEISKVSAGIGGPGVASTGKTLMGAWAMMTRCARSKRHSSVKCSSDLTTRALI